MTVEGGSICNNPLQVGLDGQSATTDGLSFASTVGSGPSCGTGVPTDNVFIANITGLAEREHPLGLHGGRR